MTNRQIIIIINLFQFKFKISLTTRKIECYLNDWFWKEGTYMNFESRLICSRLAELNWSNMQYTCRPSLTQSLLVAQANSVTRVFYSKKKKLFLRFFNFFLGQIKWINLLLKCCEWHQFWSCHRIPWGAWQHVWPCTEP